MKEGKPTNDYQFLESYGLASTSSDDNSSTWPGSNGNSNNNKSTNETTIPLFQRNAATSRHHNQQQQQQIGNVINNNDKINFQRGGGGAVESNNNRSNDWFSYNEWNNNNRSTTTSGTPIGPAPPPTNNINNTNNSNGKQPLKKILRNKNDFMIPIVRSNINSTTNANTNNTIRSKPKQHQHEHQSASNLKGDIQQSMSQTNLRHQQHRAMNENNTNKTKSRSTSRTRAYYILLFIALYGLLGFIAYLGQGVLEMVRRVQLYRQKQGWSTITSNTDSKEESSISLMLSNDITSTLQPIQHHTINIPPANQDNKPSSQSQQQESVTQDRDPIDELNQQKESFNKSPSNTLSNEMTDIIDVYTDKTLLFSENELISTFRDISDALDYHSYSAKEVSKNTNDTTSSASAVRSNEKDFPFFWLIPPYTAGGHRVTRVINECFDLTRADITGSNKHKITYNSQTRNSLNKEQILVGSNLFDLHKLFNSVDPTHQKGRMFSFFFHPIQRSAYLFETFKNKMSSDEDKASDNSIHSMDLISFSNYILSNSTAIANENEKDKKDYIFRVSNWMTRLLSQTPIGPLNKYHVDAATLVLSKKCYVGLFHKMEESIQRLLSIFHWDESSPGGRLGTQNCLEEFYGTSFVRDLVVEGSDDWLALEKLNTWDIMLYENILKIFDEQRLLLYAN